MRIVFDVSPLSHTRTGVPNYVRGLLAGIANAAGDDDEIVAWAPTSSAGRVAIESALGGLPVERRLRVLPFAHVWRQGWSRVGWPPAERFLGRFDVLHFSDWMYPPQRQGVRATTVHDLVPLRFPEWTHPRTRRMHGVKYRNAARTCDRIFANSNFTAGEVVELLHVSEDRVRVAYPGVDDAFSPDGPAEALGRPYVLTVATLEPRKNLETLLDAHRLLDGDLALAVAGGAGWGRQPRLDSAGVTSLGFVSHDRLPGLYRGADVFVYPSRFEGFGMPILEAMACGVPAVVSSHSSMDEACGDAAVRADPDDAEALAAAIRLALADRDELVSRGLAHARRFRWPQAGRAVLQGYAECL